MAKDKSTLDISNQNLEFVQNDMILKLLSFKQKDMTIDVNCYKDDKFIKKMTVPFAQIPKSLKAILRPKQ